MNRALAWVVGTVLVLAAGVVSVIATSIDQRAPFVMSGGAGEEVTSRTVRAAVHDAAFADRVTAGEWHADGRWLVVTIVASAPQSEVDAVIELATLEVVDGHVFQASERPGRSMVGTRLHVGTDTVGTLAFELPEDVPGGDALLRLSPEMFTPHLDDVIELPLSLDGLPTLADIDIEEPRLGTP